MVGNRPRMKLVTFWMVFMLTSCVTINIYFPAEKVQKAAEEIVGEIRKEEPAEKKPSSKPQSLHLYHLRICMGLTGVHAQNIETSISNAAIRDLKSRLRSREGLLRSYFDQGILGEDSQGYVAVRNLSGIKLSEVARLKRIVKATNADRKALYGEVARVLRVDPRELDRIGSIFAQEWQRTASRGWWIQDPDGAWRKK